MKGGDISTAQIALVGIAAVGGLMAGTCAAINKTLSNGQARAAILIGYAFVGLAFGGLTAALGVWLPLLDIASFRGALLTGAIGGLGGVLVIASANISSVVTLRYFGLRMTIEPDDSDRRATQRRHMQRRVDDRPRREEGEDGEDDPPL
jgi:hypothetical protein